MDNKKAVHRLNILRKRKDIGIMDDQALHHAVKVFNRIEKDELIGVILQARNDFVDFSAQDIPCCQSEYIKKAIVSYLTD